MPSVGDVIEATTRWGRLTNPDIRCVGIAVNTAALARDEARRMLEDLGKAFDLPATDPMRFGVEALVACLLEGCV